MDTFGLSRHGGLGSAAGRGSGQRVGDQGLLQMTRMGSNENRIGLEPCIGSPGYEFVDTSDVLGLLASGRA
jgi:hypothetical protein